MKIIDSHCHLDYDKFENDLDQVINRAKGSGVSKILTICTKKNKYREIPKSIQVEKKFFLNFFTNSFIGSLAPFRAKSIKWNLANVYLWLIFERVTIEMIFFNSIKSYCQ